MRKLGYVVDLNYFNQIKNEIVPTLFTKHQFELIQKRFMNEQMSDSEKNEFSRTISRKMRAINKIIYREDDNVFVYGEEKIIPQRLLSAKKYIKKFSRKFKSKHVFISGSYLHSAKYNDIDVFVVEKYNKKDQFIDEFHINYLDEDVYNSLFFASVKKLCVSNKEVIPSKIKEKADINTFISLYQELFNDLDRKFKGVKKTMREFLLQAAFISNNPILDSLELKKQVDAILKIQKPKELVKKIFVKSVILGISKRKLIHSMKQIIKSYYSIMKEYRQHKNYYIDIIQPFKEVLAIEN